MVPLLPLAAVDEAAEVVGIVVDKSSATTRVNKSSATARGKPALAAAAARVHFLPRVEGRSRCSLVCVIWRGVNVCACAALRRERG